MPFAAFWVALAALGAWVGFANPYVQFPAAVLALPLGLAALGMNAASPRRAFKLAWIAGSLACLGCLAWVYWPVHHFGDVHWLLALPVPVLLSMAMGVYHGLFGLGAHYASKRLPPLVALLFLGVSWCVMELAMGSLLSGFPWLTLSAAFVPWLAMVQPAAWVGALGLSGLFTITATGPLFWPRSKTCALISVALLATLFGLGTARLNSFEDLGKRHTVAVVQGNFDQSLKWDPSFQQETVQRYVDLSREVIAQSKPDLVVWPETAMPFYMQDETPLRTPVLRLAREAQIPFVVGSPAYLMRPGSSSYTLYNRAFLVKGNSGVSGWYDKEHLVPFGEYMPLAEYLPLQKLVQGVGDFEPGRDQKPLVSGDLALGVLICYEAIFAELAQDRVAQGANLLVNISNDAWFGATSAPLQHLQLATLRAIEQGRWLVRSTNTGISAFIDPLGHIQLAGPQFKPLAGVGTVHPRAETTLYHRLHTALRIGLCATLALLVGLMVLPGGRKKSKNRGRL